MKVIAPSEPGTPEPETSGPGTPEPGTTARREPIAIVGLGCRFPGAPSPEALWVLLRDGRDAITEIPQNRFPAEQLYDPRPGLTGRISTRFGGFLDTVQEFDAAFFGIAPHEAERLDPQQRLLLETTWEALEAGGQVPAGLRDSNTGVFVGLWTGDYEARMFRDPAGIDFHMTTGTGRYSAAGRMSHIFGWHGPSLSIDCACSSSLVAVHLACHSLRAGECDLAVAGGANVMLEPSITLAYSQARMMAPDGRCKFGDARANGYVRSEGVGVVVLKRLSQALADGDPVQAVILGSAINNDGDNSGPFGRPARAGHRDLLTKACRDAAVDPSGIDYVEAHGTGTRAGDPVEVEALADVLGAGRSKDAPLLLGSVKTNIGHTEAAAGIAGLLKVVLAMKHGCLPRSLHFETPNPYIPWDRLPVDIVSEPRPWTAGARPRRAGVNSFGISGTNAHVILEEPPARRPEAASAASDRCEWLPVSGRSESALREAARAYSAWLGSPEAAIASLQDIAWSAGARHSHHEYRLAVPGRSIAEWREGLDVFVRGEAGAAIVGSPQEGSRRRVVFVFPGQGGQWAGMGRALLKSSAAFQGAVKACDAAFRPYVDWSLLQVLEEGEDARELADISIVQPTLFAVEYALASVWNEQGVRPDAVIGHSMGEVAAAAVAGALSLDAAARVICRRSQLLRRISGRGAMAVVDLSLADAEAAIAGREDRISVAVSNSSRSTVLSGEPEAIDAVLAGLEQRDVFCRRIKVDVASHSPQVDPLLPELIAVLGDMAPVAPATPWRSTVLDRWVGPGTADAAYWASNLRQPVRLAAATAGLIEEGFDTFIEIGPHPVLLPAIQQEVASLGRSCATIGTLKRDADEERSVAEAVGTAYVNGVEIDWTARQTEPRSLVALPAYAWQRERFWYDAPAAGGRGTGRLLPDRPLSSSVHAGASFWECTLSTAALPELPDHRVRGAVVVPAALLLALVTEAGRQLASGSSPVVDRFSIHEALTLPEEVARAVQLVAREVAQREWVFEIASRDVTSDDGAWRKHGEARVRAGAEPRQPAARVDPPADATTEAAEAHVAAMERRGLSYGPAFRSVREVSRGTGQGSDRLDVTLDLPDALRTHDAIRRSAVLLDGALQAAVAALASDPAIADADTFVPVDCEDVELAPGWAGLVPLRCGVTLSPGLADNGQTFAVSVTLTGEGDTAVGRIGLVRLRKIARLTAGADALLYRLRWQPQPLASVHMPDTRSWLVVGGGAPSRALSDELVRGLTARGVAARRVEAPADGATSVDWIADAVASFARASAPVSCGVVCVTPFEVEPAGALTDGSLEQAEWLAGALPVAVVQALVRAGQEQARVWFVTRDAQRVVQSDRVEGVAGALAWGVQPVVATEHPGLTCSIVDLGTGDASEVSGLVEELCAATPETRVAWRGAERFVARLAQTVVDAASTTVSVQATVPGGRPFRMHVRTPGVLDSFVARALDRRAPGPGEVEVEVKAVGLNFMNVMGAMGIYPGYPQGVGPLGIECSGRVSAVGADVRHLAVGDAVFGMAFDCLATHALTDARLLCARPTAWTDVEAATIPIAYATVLYALRDLARVRPGERVLVHSGTGGVGMAALQMLRWMGAEVVATAGTPEKRAWLRAQGVTAVADSRSADFDTVLRQELGGEGVDVVLNSLAGGAIAAGLGLLRDGGRFIEIGKRDIYDNTAVGLWPFHRNLSYFAVDLDRLARQRPALVGDLLAEIVSLSSAGHLTPLPARAFSVEDAADAFRTMARGAHTGKLVLSLESASLPVEIGDAEQWAPGTWLVTGGLGALGAHVARWLADRGASSIALVGRSAPSAAATAAIEELRARGVRVAVHRADSSDADQTSRLIEQIGAAGPPLLGVVHAAGLLDDATLLEQSLDRMRRACAPKVRGSWNLHRATASTGVKSFVLYSSAVALVGSPGQANYAAANAFLDALAEHRRAAGLPAVSVAWGPWSEIGLAASDRRGGRLTERGLASITPAEGADALSVVFNGAPPTIGVMRFDLTRWTESYAGSAHQPLFADLRLGDAGAPVVAKSGPRQDLVACDPDVRRTRLETLVRDSVAQVLRLPAPRVELQRPFKSLGLDSLTALELRNRLELALGEQLPATLAWNHPTVVALAAHLAERLGEVRHAEPVLPAPGDLDLASDAELESLLSDVETLSDDDVRRLLAEDH